jgi:hypothetical protein
LEFRAFELLENFEFVPGFEFRISDLEDEFLELRRYASGAFTPLSRSHEFHNLNSDAPARYRDPSSNLSRLDPAQAIRKLI